MGAIETQMDPSVSSPRMRIQWDNFTVRGINHREIPKQNVDTELAITLHECMQKIAETGRFEVSRVKPEAAIELPARDEDKSLRSVEG